MKIVCVIFASNTFTSYNLCALQVIRGIDLIGKKLDCIVMSRSDQMMFVAAANGSVLSVNFPIIEKAVFQEYHMHDKTVTKVATIFPRYNG